MILFLHLILPRRIDYILFRYGREGNSWQNIHATGEMAEWSIAAVLKTVELRGSRGSNPFLSAKDR